MATELSALGIKITGTGIVKTTSDLDKFAVAAKAAGQAASKPINVRVSGSTARLVADLKAMEKALSGVRSMASGGIKFGTAGNAKAIADINRMGTALREARAAARRPINVSVTANGVGAAITELNRFTAAIERARTATASPITARTGSSGGGFEGPSSGAIGAVGAMKNAVLGLVSAYALLAGARAYADLTDSSKMLTAQLKLATNESGNFAQAQKDVRAIASEVRTDLDSTAQLYGKLMLNSKQLGITQIEAARATETVAKAFKVSGASTVEASQGTRQLVQALQSGVLRGDEFNTMAEAAPRLQKLLADSLGVTQGQLRKMAEEGELTSAKLTRAFTDKKFTDALDKEFAQLPVTFGDAMAQISNAAIITFGAFDEGGQFSKSILNFALGGSKGLADMENAARQMGVTVNAELVGLIDGFNKLTDIIKNAAMVGIDMISRIISPVMDLRAALNSLDGGWADILVDGFKRALAFLNPLASAWNALLRSLGQGARDASKMQGTDRARTAKYDALLGNVDQFVNRSGASSVGPSPALLDKATKARKGLTDAEREAKRVADEAKRAYEQKVKASNDYIESLQRENAEFGKSAKELRLMEVARRMDAAATDEQRKAIQAASDQREMNIGVKELTDAKKLADQRERDLQLIRDETDLQRQVGEARIAALKGLSGDALENELARISDEYEIQNILLRANAEAARDAANAAHILAMAQAEVAQVRLQQGQANDERTFEQNKQKTLGLAYDIADIVGGCFGDGAREVIRILEETLPGVFADLGKEFGVAFEAFSKGAKTGGVFGAMTGSTTGGAIGGGLGQVLGKEFLTKGLESIFKGLGKFAGPLGAIAGGILGGVIGGLLKKTPKASATVSIIAGEAMDTAITGNKASLKKIAGGLADSVISGLSGLADQLGADLIGNAKVSIGIRKKNYRVDPTGMGRTKGAGVEDFGEDQAAAIAFAIQTAIQQGVLDGLSESMKRLIMADGDFQAQLQKAMSFKSVFDELAQNDDPAQWAQDQITKWHDAMAKIFAEAGATSDELAELERLTGLKRTEAAAEAAKEAAEKAKQLATDRRNLEIQIMELEGRSAQALAATRQLELDAMDASLRPLQERVYALQDEAEAAEALAAKNAAWRDLQIQLLEATGRSAEAEKARRDDVLAGMDAYSQVLQKLIWSAQDATAASEALAASQKEIADEAAGIERQILEARGDTNAIRALELSGLNEANRARMQYLYTLQDEAARLNERDGLMTQWLTAIGDEASLRARALAKLDPSNRALQQQIWAYEDAQKAAQAEIDARNQQIEAIQSTASALESARDQYAGFAQTIREFKNELFAPKDGGALSFEQTQAQFKRTASMAAMGDATALQGFTGSAQAFLDAAMNNASSLVDYQRALGLVAGASDAAVTGADAIAGQAAAQLQAIQDQVTQLQALNEQTTQSVLDLDKIEAVQANDVVPTLERLLKEFQDTGDKAVSTRLEEKAEAIAIISNLSEQNAMLRQLIEGGSLNVRVRNETDEPVPTLEVTP